MVIPTLHIGPVLLLYNKLYSGTKELSEVAQ